MPEKRIGWYSERQHRIIADLADQGFITGPSTGSLFYKRPDGSIVAVTEIKVNDSTSNFPDAVCLGEVSECMGDGPEPVSKVLRIALDLQYDFFLKDTPR